MKRTSVEERRAEILETTCRVVVERGFGATRIVDVAGRLGISTGLIHYHFDSKDQLFAEALEYAANADLARLSEEVARDTTALDRLDRVFSLYAPADADARAVWVLWIDGWGEAMRSPTLKRISQELDVRWKELLEGIIIDGVAAGEFTCADPNAAAWRLAALLDGLGVQVTVHDSAIDAAQLLCWVREAAVAELHLRADAFDRLAASPAVQTI